MRIYKERNGEVLLDQPVNEMNKAGKTPIMKYKIKDFYDFAANCPLENLDFLGDFALHAMVSSDNELNKRMMAKRKIFPLATMQDRQEKW